MTNRSRGARASPTIDPLGAGSGPGSNGPMLTFIILALAAQPVEPAPIQFDALTPAQALQRG